MKQIDNGTYAGELVEFEPIDNDMQGIELVAQNRDVHNFFLWSNAIASGYTIFLVK